MSYFPSGGRATTLFPTGSYRGYTYQSPKKHVHPVRTHTSKKRKRSESVQALLRYQPPRKKRKVTVQKAFPLQPAYIKKKALKRVVSSQDLITYQPPKKKPKMALPKSTYSVLSPTGYFLTSKGLPIYVNDANNPHSKAFKPSKFYKQIQQSYLKEARENRARAKSLKHQKAQAIKDKTARQKRAEKAFIKQHPARQISLQNVSSTALIPYL